MPTLRTLSLVLVYFATEYVSSVKLKSLHCNKIDIQLNHSIKPGTVKSTPAECSQFFATFCHHIFGKKMLHAESGQNIYLTHPFHYTKT